MAHTHSQPGNSRLSTQTRSQRAQSLRAGLLGASLLCVLAGGACASGSSATPASRVSAGAGGAATGGATSKSEVDLGGAGALAAMGGTGGQRAAQSGNDAGRGGARASAGTGGKAPAAPSGGAGGAGGKPSSAGGFELPPLNAGLDYQLGGAYTPVDSVKIVSRDRKAKPATGLYNICYVNGFQAQQEENDFWLNQHPDLVLRDQSGQPVIDKDWDEMLFDISTDAKRKGLTTVMTEWIAGCKSAGFDAVEIDNLDSYSRSGGRLKEDDAVAFVRMLADAAHANGMAIAQKNSSELVSRKSEMGTDFVVAEECNRYQECEDYRKGYGDHVLVIEYRRADFDAGCAAFPQLSIVLRDVELRASGSSGYVFDGC